MSHRGSLFILMWLAFLGNIGTVILLVVNEHYFINAAYIIVVGSLIGATGAHVVDKLPKPKKKKE